MNASVIVIGDDALDVERSSGSVSGDPTLAGAEVLQRAASDRHPWVGATGESVMFLRAGDRLLPGAGGEMLGALSGCGIAVGAHRLAGRGNWATEVVPPAFGSYGDLLDVAVDVPFELSAIASKRSILPDFVAPAPAAPGGEVALLAALLARARCESTHVVVAQVRMRALHHGDPDALLDRLLGVLHGPLGEDDAVASRIRRRALSVAYLESPPSVAARFRPDAWWAPAGRSLEPARLLAVLRDLHWIAARLAEARHVAVVGFEGFVAGEPNDALATLPPDLNSLAIANELLHRQLGERNAAVQWLHEEVRVRDAALAASGLRGSTIEQTNSRDLARELLRRTRRHLRRLSRGGSAE